MRESSFTGKNSLEKSVLFEERVNK